MLYNSDRAETKTIWRTAELMVTAARTAPKASGRDHLYAAIADGEEKRALADEMRRLGSLWNQSFIVRDGEHVEFAECIVLLGATDGPLLLANCGYCGFSDCGACMRAKGRCAHNTIDLGIAIGSAVSVAADHRVDNRVLYSAGKAALHMGLLPPEVRIAVGIPLSATSKNVFFDRGSEDHEAMLRRVMAQRDAGSPVGTKKEGSGSTGMDAEAVLYKK